MPDQRRKPHVGRGRFYNHDQEHIKKRLLHEVFFALRLLARSIVWKGQSFFPQNITPEEWSVKPEFVERSTAPLITWVGHATFLIQINGVNIITDPVFGDVSCFFKRRVYPVMTLEELPPIDVVLISHNHRDHCDTPTLKRLAQLYNSMIFVPLGDKSYAASLGFSSVSEMNWWEGRLVDTSNGLVRITFLPAHHWSGRGLFDINRSLWGSWHISANTSGIYFAGDTSYSNHFKEIARHDFDINVALMPIGPAIPEQHMRRSHTSPEEALQGCLDLKSSYFIPMHWGTFQSGYDTFNEALQLLFDACSRREKELTNLSLQCLKFGEQWLYPH